MKSALPSRYTTPQVKPQIEPYQRPQVDPQTVLKLHQEFQTILQNCHTDFYLVDMLEALKLFPNDPQLLQFLRQSSQNMVVKQINLPDNENIQKNLFRVFCAIMKVQLNQRDSSYIDERVIQQYLDSVNLEREFEMIYIDELSAIKGLINRPTYALTDRQVKLVHDKFRNLYDNRINYIQFENMQPQPLPVRMIDQQVPVQQVPVVKSSPRR